MRLQKPDEHDPAARIRARREEAKAKADAAAPVAAPAPALLELDPADIDLLPPLPEDGGGLDKVMLAMDVVDTLRHQQDLVEHALSQDERDAELIARIRRIYADQGIEVSDAAITEGVQALKKDRFVYQPPARGFGRRLAHLYVDRGKWTRRAGIVGGLVLAVWLAFAVPDWIEAGQRAGAVRTEVADLRSRLAQAQERLASTQRAQAALTAPAGAAGQRLLADARAEAERAAQALAQAQAAVPRLDGVASLADGNAVEQILVPLRAPLADAEQALQQAETRLADLSSLGGLEAALGRALAALAGGNLSPAANADVQVIHAQARQALAAGDVPLARGRIDRLNALAETVNQSYELRILSRPNEQSGVWRHPAGNRNARNYYIIVEAVGQDGRPVELPITSEEDQVQRRVSRFGIRVPQNVYDAVRADKLDNGLIDNPVFAVKRRGDLDAVYRHAVAGGYITSW